MNGTNLPDDLEEFLNNVPQTEAHEFEVDLRCLVTINHKITMDGIEREENEAISSLESSPDFDDLIQSEIRHQRIFYDGLRIAARLLTVVALVTRLHHWAIAYAKRLDTAREPGGLEKELSCLTCKFGQGRIGMKFFLDLAEIRNSVIHQDSQPKWEYKGHHSVALCYAPTGWRLEFSEEQLADAIEKAILQVTWFDKKLQAIGK